MDNPRQLNGYESHEHHELVPRHGQTLNLRPYTQAPSAPSDGTDDFAILMQYVWILWRHRWALVLTLIAGGLAGFVVSLWMTPLYRASTSLEIQSVQEPFNGPMAAAVGDPNLVTQTQLLSSRTMRDRTLSKLSAKANTEPPQVRGPLASMRNLFGLTDPAVSTSWGEAVGMAAATLTVTNPRESRVVVIQSDSPKPQAAADFTNTLAQEYIDRNQEQRWESYENTGAWLTRAQEELKAKLEASEQRLAEYARAKGLLFTGSGSSAENISEDKLKQLQGALLIASSDRIARQSVFESSRSSPTVLDSGPMAQYQAKLADLRRELAELSATLTPAHYRTQRVQAQIDELESAREKERANIISRIQVDYEAALKRENQLRRDFEAQSHVVTNQADDLIEYNIRLREVETNKKLYDATLQQGKEASLASAMRTSNARVVDPARVPRFPQKPNLPLNLALGMLSGLLCGVAFIVVRSRADVSIQAPGLLEFHLNLRELGVIPAATADPGLRALPATPRALGPSTAKNGARERILRGGNDSADCLELITWSRKPSVIAEAFRTTMTSILFSGENGDRPRVLVITSPSPQEGKSTIVSNLAIALAEINHRVLLIDGDMRLPRIHTVFDLPNTFGLSDVLHERKPVQEYVDESLVRKTHIPNLYVLPAGPARTNLSRLLYSTRMKELITRFRDSFDTILIDTAPVLSVPDSRILARAADAVILVVRAHRTHQEAAFAAARCFEDDGRRILGTILNDWNPKMSAYGQYNSYGGYYSRYLHIEDQ